MSWRRPGATEVRRSKFGAVRTVFDGRSFASIREAERYRQLQLLALAGHITHLQLQPSFDLHAVGGQRIAKYIADFAYTLTATGETVTEDVKGVRTPVYRLKKKWVEAEHGIRLVEV